MSSSQPGIFRRILKGALRVSWISLGIALAFFFFLTWTIMWLGEAGKPISAGANYWWYFIVTAFTVGYGDLFPVTTLGRLSAVLTMVGGIGMFSIIAAKLIDKILDRINRRRRGEMEVHAHDHFLVLGYRTDDTKRLIADLRRGNEKVEIVLCVPSDVLGENPFSPKDNIEFVRGTLTGIDTLTRAHIQTARRVIVFTPSDEESFVAVLAAEQFARPEAHVVVFLSDRGKIELLEHVKPGIEAIPSVAVEMLAQSAEAPGSSRFVLDLISNGGSFNQYRTAVGEGFKETDFIDFLGYLKESNLDAILVGYTETSDPSSLPIVNPSAYTALKPGMCLLYFAAREITSKELEALSQKA